MEKKVVTVDKKKIKKSFKFFFYHSLMPKIYGIGAAVVIIGAMFKLLNLEGASTMLAVGLTTEAILFILGAFEPATKEYDWSIVYPELSGDENLAKNQIHGVIGQTAPISLGPVVSLENLLSNGGLKKESLSKLVSGLEHLTEYTDNLSSLSKASFITGEYYNSMVKASSVLVSISNIQEKISGAVSIVKELESGNQQYSAKMGSIFVLLDNVSDLYKKEISLLETNLSKQSSIFKALEQVSGDSLKFKDGLKTLSTTVESLNSVYGKVLSAMKN